VEDQFYVAKDHVAKELPRQSMAYETAKLMLRQAGTFQARAEAIKIALSSGMPLSEIEEYLDWLDATGPPLQEEPPEEVEPGAS
jgi:hypothetical protein